MSDPYDASGGPQGPEEGAMPPPPPPDEIEASSVPPGPTGALLGPLAPPRMRLIGYDAEGQPIMGYPVGGGFGRVLLAALVGAGIGAAVAAARR